MRHFGRSQIIFNGIYFSDKPSEISMASQELALTFKQEKISLYAHFKVGHSKFNILPKSFDLEYGFNAHLKRLN